MLVATTYDFAYALTLNLTPFVYCFIEFYCLEIDETFLDTINTTSQNTGFYALFMTRKCVILNCEISTKLFKHNVSIAN